MSYEEAYLEPTSAVTMELFLQKKCLRLLAVRSSHRRCSNKKSISKKFAKSTGKHLWHSLFFNKIASLRPGTLLRKSVFLWFLKILRTSFYRTVWKNPSKHISTDRRYFYCIFKTHMTSICEKVFLAEVQLIYAEQMSL